jgi:hypothetical protein
MPRYLVERDFGRLEEDRLRDVAVRSKVIGVEHYADICWEHSHVCAGEDGTIKSFCIYSGPSAERVLDHAQRLGGHVVDRIYEIIGDVDPEEIVA